MLSSDSFLRRGFWPCWGGHGNPLQYSCLQSPHDRGAWRTRVHGVAKSLNKTEQLSTAQTPFHVEDSDLVEGWCVQHPRICVSQGAAERALRATALTYCFPASVCRAGVGWFSVSFKGRINSALKRAHLKLSQRADKTGCTSRVPVKVPVPLEDSGVIYS